MRNMKVIRLCLLMTLLWLLTACTITTADPTPQLVIPTAVARIDSPIAEATPTAPLPMPPTFQPSVPSTNEPTRQPIPQPTDDDPRFQVAFVTNDDTLNVRNGPGVDFDVVGELAPNAAGVEITGPGELVSGSTWVPIAAGGLTGWVNGRFLAETISKETFCENAEITKLLADLETTVINQDGNLLAQLIHPERGLRIHHAWWNPEVRISQFDVRQIFTSTANYDWGRQDGSGLPIVGSFKENILPLLQEDLVLATETSCDEIIHGATAGLVRLPEGYDMVHYYSLHRPGTDEFAGMNWGTWVVGVEKWQGTYYVSFLVHFQWEI